MNTTRGETAQVPGQRSKTFGDHLKAALPYLGAALAVGGAAYGANKYMQGSGSSGGEVNFSKPSRQYRDPFE
jgi:F0F1-type ATP synthase membrane subunit c/vacuolar-type H+-ATPase subunit K